MPFPIIPVAMAGLSLLESFGQKKQAKSARAHADELSNSVPRVDPGVLSLLNDVRQHRRYVENGGSKMLGLKRTLIGDAGAQAMTNLGRTSGGDTGSLVGSQLRSQMLTQRALAGAAADTEQMIPGYLQMEAPLRSDIADRQLSLSLDERDQERVRAARLERDSRDNFWGALGLLGSADYSGGNAGDIGNGTRRSRPSLSSGGFGGSEVDSPVPTFEFPNLLLDQEPLIT